MTIKFMKKCTTSLVIRKKCFTTMNGKTEKISFNCW